MPSTEKKIVPLIAQSDGIRPAASYDAGVPSPYHSNPPRSRSPDSELSISGQGLRDWARHLADNSSIVNAILSSRISNGVGRGLTYEPMARDRNGKLSVDLNNLLRKIHVNWSRSVDIAGELSRAEYERLAWRTWDIDGEVFTRKIMKSRKGGKLPYFLQMLDSTWIPHNLIQEHGGRYIVHGIEKDEWLAPIRYFIEPNYSDIFAYLSHTFDVAKAKTIPADQMNHLKRVKRPNQTRGVTLLHSVIYRIADIAEYQEAHRLAARASADLFASVNRSPEYDVDQSSNNQRSWNFEHLQMLDELQPGESVNFHTPAHPNQNATEFVLQELKQIATGVDVGSSQISHVFDASYAAQRLEVVDVFRKTEAARQQFIDDLARPMLYENVILTAFRLGKIPQKFLRKLDIDTLLDCRIEGPQMPVIDPVKDRAAYEKDQMMQWNSRQGIIRQLGRIPSEVDGERETDPSIHDINEENEAKQ